MREEDMSKISAIAVCAGLIILAGCAGRNNGDAQETSQKIIRENEHRINNLENSVTALNSQIAQLNNRVYEVRTRSGQKTSMTVVPIIKADAAAPAGNINPGPTTPAINPPAAAPAPARPAAQAVTPAPAPVVQNTPAKGRKINPASKPSPLPAHTPATQAPKPPVAQAAAGARGSIGQPEQVAGPAGQLSAQAANNSDIGLPPAEVPVPRNNVEHANSFTGQATTSTISPQEPSPHSAIPVPLMPAGDLSLPPETPTAAAQTATPPAAAPQQSAAAQPARGLQQGEEAAYRAALNAARTGHTAEGIRLFRDFLQKYPNGRFMANADYWIGECLYAQGKYQDALSQFQTVNTSFPKHHKNADALLKAGMTLNRLGDKAGAQAKFRDVLASFPNSDAARRVRAMGVAR